MRIQQPGCHVGVEVIRGVLFDCDEGDDDEVDEHEDDK
jgi:hypothetical protein